jgi:hypothetical protein
MVGIVVTISPNLSLYKIVVLPVMHSVASAQTEKRKKKKKKNATKHNAQRDRIFSIGQHCDFFFLSCVIFFLVEFRLTGCVEADHENAHVLLAKARKEFAKDISHFRVVEKFQKESLLCVLCGDATEKKSQKKKKKCEKSQRRAKRQEMSETRAMRRIGIATSVRLTD